MTAEQFVDVDGVVHSLGWLWIEGVASRMSCATCSPFVSGMKLALVLLAPLRLARLSPGLLSSDHWKLKGSPSVSPEPLPSRATVPFTVAV